MSKLIPMFGFAAMGGIAVTNQAFAHAHLKSAAPAPGSTLTAAPAELDLTFLEGVNLKFTGVNLTGPGKAPVQTGEATLMGGDTTFIVPISGTLVPGVYTVAWHALSADGHKAVGRYMFTVNR
jgi:methionine-rich copper-binding protein CopC